MKAISIGLSYALLLQYAAPPALAQTTPASINIVVVEGEGAVDNYRQHVQHVPVIRVEDENRKPVADAAVVFTLPTEGATGVFGNGSKTFIVKTDANGTASAKTMRVNDVSGKLVIHVSASYRGLTAQSLINQTNEGVPGAKASSGGGGGGKVLLILAIVGAAAGGGAYYALSRNKNTATSVSTGGGSTTVTPPAAIGLTPGSGSIIGPH